MNKLALISAKKDRLNVLRKQYEAYLLRAYANHRPPGSVTGDSGIASQNEDKHTKKTVMMAHPDLAPAEARGVLSPRVHLGAPDRQSSQPRSISVSKFHDQTAVGSLNNPPMWMTTPVDATFDVDHRQTNAPRGPHIYGPVPNAQYPQTIPFNYNESAPRSLQHIPDIRVSYAEAPVLSVAHSSDNIQPHAVPANRFFREHMESVQAASGLSATAQFPVGSTVRYAETSRNVPVPRQFDPSTLLQYHNANMLVSDPRLQVKNPSDTATVEPSLVTGKSSTYRMEPDVNVVNQIGSLPGYMDYILASSQKSDDEGSARSITSEDLDGLIRRNERLLWENADVVKTPRRSPTALGMDNVNLDENGRTTILENELDRYISNIRKLHREHAVQSLDDLDHEQNTSGDLLNVSLSEDALELPVEERVRKERVPEEMGKILALASDLASRTATLKEVARDSTAIENDSSSKEVGDGIKHREIAKSEASEFKGKCETEGRATSTRNKIRKDVATHSMKLEQPRGDAKIAKENWNNVTDSAGSREHDRQVSITRKDNADKETITSHRLRIDDPKNMSNEKQLDLATGKESNTEELSDAVEELAPQDLASMQKKVGELRLDDFDGAMEKHAEDTVEQVREEVTSKSCDSSQFAEQNGVDNEIENARSSQDALPRLETKKLDANETNKTERQNETDGPIEDAQSVPSKILSQYLADEPKIASQPDEKLGEPGENDRIKQDEVTELRSDDQSEGVKEYSEEQEHVEDPSQAQQYEQQDPNQQYYDPNIPYEAGNEVYEGYDQGYAQEGQDYVEYVDGQYEQYPEDLSNQQYQHYSDAQYEQNSNQAYNYTYDPNQGYGDPNQQYDPNQGYENNPDNRAYDYTEQVAYDSNQTYNAYEQEYKEEQCNPDDDVKDRAEKPETEDVSQRQANPEPDHHKSDGDGTKLQQADAANEANQPKKKDVIKSLLDSDTDSTIERNVSNTESDFDFN
ncbi:uncharacterized protein LOC105831932 isoform X2 [Monomorium pharaonis]|nr:uncharacterized protein LOC105831932 isoform X2 [Monomorium pharaonis]